MRNRVPFKLPAGVVRDASPIDASGAWYETDHIRWVNNKLQPIGGYELTDPNFAAFASQSRCMFTWADNIGLVRTAILCDRNIYVISNGILEDITPVDGLAYRDANTPFGYGTGLYGTGLYGTARPFFEGLVSVGRSFHMDNFGQDLLIMTSDDTRLLIWKPDVGGVARAVIGAPSGRTFVVTPERFVMIFGKNGDSRTFGWDDQESIDVGPSDWDIEDVTGQAGEFSVESAAVIAAVQAVKQGTLFFTARFVYLTYYSGTPYFYSYKKVGDRSYPISSQALSNFADSGVWLSDNGFWLYSGGNVSSLACPLFGWFKELYDPDRSKETAFALNLELYPEIYWFFPSLGSQENDTYIMWNYQENWWAMGKLMRSCGVGSQYTTPPYMSDGIKVYSHETGTSYANVEARAFALSAAWSIGQGSQGTIIQLGVNNDALDESSPLFSVYGKYDRRNLGGYDESAENMTSIDGFIDPLVSGTDFFIKVESPDNVKNSWTVGESLVLIKGRGNR